MELLRFAPTLLAAEWEKFSPVFLIVLVAVPIILAAVLLAYAKSRVALGQPRWQLWLALVPLVAGTYLAYKPLKYVGTGSYRTMYFLSDRAVMLHYSAFFVPAGSILLFAGIILYGGYRDKMER